MDLTTARARIHAMLADPDGHATEELDRRLDALVSAVLYDAAATASECCAIRLRREAVDTAHQKNASQ